VLTVLVPWGTDGMATRTARAVLAHAEPCARLVFSMGWHAARDARDRYTAANRITTALLGLTARLTGRADIADHKRAAEMVYRSDRDWTVVRAADLEDGPSEGMPLWAPHVGDPRLRANRLRRTDFALFMVRALTDPAFVREAPAIAGRGNAPVTQRDAFFFVGPIGLTPPKTETIMTHSAQTPAFLRLAGLLYLVIIVCGISAEVLFRGPLVDFADPAATASAIRNATGSCSSLAYRRRHRHGGRGCGALAILLYVIFPPGRPGARARGDGVPADPVGDDRDEPDAHAVRVSPDLGRAGHHRRRLPCQAEATGAALRSTFTPTATTSASSSSRINSLLTGLLIWRLRPVPTPHRRGDRP
jgi:hypothetical protein